MDYLDFCFQIIKNLKKRTWKICSIESIFRLFSPFGRLWVVFTLLLFFPSAQLPNRLELNRDKVIGTSFNAKLHLRLAILFNLFILTAYLVKSTNWQNFHSYWCYMYSTWLIMPYDYFESWKLKIFCVKINKKYLKYAILCFFVCFDTSTSLK